VRLIAESTSLFLEKKMSINTREARALVSVMESLLDSLDKTFDSLPSEIDQKVKDAKLTLLNVDTTDERKNKFIRIFR
jgi:hypothetical protein